MLVSELMTPDPHIVVEGLPIEAAARHMIQQSIRHLPMVDGLGRMSGWVLDSEVFRRGGFLDVDRGWLAFEADWETLLCSDVAVAADVILGPDMDLGVALRRLAATRQDAVAVVNEDGHPIGVLTEHDVLALAMAELDPDLSSTHEGTLGVTSLDVSEPAERALKQMLEHDHRHAVVSRGGTFAGVVSVRDLIADDAGGRPDLVLEDVLRSTRPYAAPLGTSLLDIATQMKVRKVGCIPLLNERDVAVGIVTRHDILEAAVAALEASALFPDGGGVEQHRS